MEGDLALIVNEISHFDDVWVLDSGASYHMCPNREWFSTYQQIDGGNVSMANSVVCKIVGIVSVKIRTHDAVYYTLDEVRHVPLMTKSLISLSVLNSKSCNFKGKGGAMYVYKGSEVILKGIKCGTLYFLSNSTITGYVVVESSVVHKENMTKLWHMRLGHMSEKGMQVLSKRDLLCGHKVQNLEFCEHCIFGKLHRSKFPNGVHRMKGTLDYIHSDCWGPSRVESLRGNRHFMSIIDNY